MSSSYSTWLAVLVLLTGCSTAANSPPPRNQENSVPQTLGPSVAVIEVQSSPCGNGRLDSHERCDDGNQRSGDGCSEECRLEAVALLGGAAVLSNGELVTLPAALDPGGEPISPWGDGRVASVLTHDHHGAVLRGDPPSVFSTRHSSPIALPGPLAEAHLVGESLVALPNGELWWLLSARVLQKSCAGVRGTDAELGPTATGDRWCRIKREPTTITSLAGHCWVDATGSLHCMYDEIDTNIGPRRATSVTGTQHRCVLTDRGEVGCWGNASFGELGHMGVGPDDRGAGNPEVFEQPNPPSEWLTFDSPATDVLAVEGKTFVLLANGTVWAWGNVKGPFVGHPQDQEYYERMGPPASSGKWSRMFRAPGASTLPSGPLQLPVGCIAKAIGDGCVICESGCLTCWNDAATLAAAECHVF